MSDRDTPLVGDGGRQSTLTNGSEPDDLTIGELIESRDDIADLREWYKDFRKRHDGVDSVKDLTPLTPGNDLAYITPANLERAEWFADVWRQEGRPEIHPRGMHYRILGKGYGRPRSDEDYQNNTKSWNDMADSAFYAQVLGLVDADKIRDEKNPDPTVTIQPGSDRTLEDIEVSPGTGVQSPRVPTGVRSQLQQPNLSADTVEDLIESQASSMARSARHELHYDALTRQSHYVEIWAEKSGVIPEDVAREYGAVIRPAGGGEMSYNMARDAVQRADNRGQDLAIVLISDFDPKGRDMPKSVARKVEVEAAMYDIEAEIHHAAVTQEQVEEYALPGEPAKTPEGLGTGNAGAQAYERHKEIFADWAGQHPVEIQSFSGRHPEAWKEEIEKYVEPYYDPDLEHEIRKRLDELTNELASALEDVLSEHEDAISEALENVEDAIEAYNDEAGDEFEEVREAMTELSNTHEQALEDSGFPEARDGLADALDVDFSEAFEAVDAEMPEGRGGSIHTPLLDTSRPLLEQLDHYHEFDIRQ